MLDRLSEIVDECVNEGIEQFLKENSIDQKPEPEYNTPNEAQTTK